MLGDVEVNHMAALVAQHDEHVKNPKRDGGDGEEVDAGEFGSLITEECPPALRRWPSVPDQVLGHRGLGDLDTQHQEFPMHARRVKEGIVLRNATAEISHILRDRPSAAAARSGSPRLVQPETSTVPAHQRIRVEYSQCVDAAGPQPVEPHPEETPSLAEVKSPLVPVGDHRQLLSRRQDLKMETSAASEQASQG